MLRGFEVEGVGFEGFRASGVGRRVWDSRFRIWGFEVGVQD